MSGVLGIENITLSSVREIFDQCLRRKGPKILDITPPSFHPRSDDYWQGARSNRVQQYESYRIDLCHRLRECAARPESHVTEIDAVLSSAFECYISLDYRHRSRVPTADEVVQRAHNILKRLPPTSLEMMNLPSGLDSRYFWAENFHSGIVSNLWDFLKVSNWISISLVEITLLGVAYPLATLDESANEFAQIFETASRLAAEASSKSEIHEWFVVRAAIWSLWHRTITLCLYFELCENLRKGFSGEYDFLPHLRDPLVASNTSIRKEYERYATKYKANSMCSWAFGLLLKSSVSLGMDFRTFHYRYRQIWSQSSSRCRLDSDSPCLGRDPDECRRFKGLKVIDQTLHDISCSPETCIKLVWDEKSYRERGGARAVCLDDEWETTSVLKYCNASDKTLAISHVWSHGQGGRPHDGINSCLHRRYVQVCHNLGCSEYWWDAPCIPEDHELRQEAISNINSIFENSKATLVCDQDFMNIDISYSSVSLLESILATALVCDWNLRAWTFLESFRGRHQIHLLCKNNKTINFRNMCLEICNHGSVDLAIFALSLVHMLPQELSSLRLDSSKPKLDSSTEAKDSSTFLRIEDAGAYLSYRPASRIGDDVVIWSLLTGTGNFDVAEELWLSPHTQTQPFGNRYLYTGFLISSAPRSTKQGLSWLPTTPYFKSSKMPMEDAHNPLRAFSAGNSMFGEFSEKGLKAYWLVYEFDTLDLTPLERTAQDTGGELKKITQRYLKGHRWGALLQARLNLSYFSANADNLAKYKGQIDGTPLAIVGSCNSTRPSKLPMEDGGWTWKGIYVWRKEVKLPDFQEVLDFFIE